MNKAPYQHRITALPITLLEREHKLGRFWWRVALFLLIIGMFSRSNFLIGVALCLTTFVGIAWIWDRVSLWGLRYRRLISESRASLGESVELTLEVHNLKPLPLMSLEIEDVFPVALRVSEVAIPLNRVTQRGEFRSFWTLGAFQHLRRHYTLECTQRGYHRFGPARLMTGDGIGLFNRTAACHHTQTLIVYPPLYSVADLRLPAKTPLGDWVSKQHLFEDPLCTAGVCEWQSGDSLQRVHWKAMARHQQMLSRIYEPSEEPPPLAPNSN